MLERAKTMTEVKGEYIQYGCGLSCPEGWINFDGSPRLRFEKIPFAGNLIKISGKAIFPKNVAYGDIIKGLPIRSGAAKGVYCSHVLEHLDRTSVERALNNSLKLLKPGGVFRLVVPDLTWRSRLFLETQAHGQPEAADEFMKSTYLGVVEPVSGITDRLRHAFGNSAHRWMYDLALMKRLLENAGFVDIRRCAFGDADDPMFNMVEEYDRFFDSGHEELAIEARRPTGR